jgi:uncharacterized protein (TIGR00725 family)
MIAEPKVPSVDASRIYVAVVGSGEADEAMCATAEAVGRLLAQQGAVLVCGGLGGVMEAACRGARSGRGTTIGILPGPDRAGANPFVEVAIATGMGEARNALVVRAADALVAVGGEFGTLSEIALALRDGKPVIGIDTWELRRGGRVIEEIVSAESADAAVDLAISLARARLIV